MAEAEAGMVRGAQDHDKAVLDKASTWVANYIGTVRPTVTYIFVLELVCINIFLCYYLYTNPGLISSMDDVLRYADIIFSADEMAMLGGIIGFWFGSRTWSKK
jgi:adenosylmethionine-8-amino-7-oxononanoate aminotransferase